MPEPGDGDPPQDLDSVVELLYGLDPAEFTSRRDAIAASLRRSDRELAGAVKALRRPSAAAHTVNLLARHQPEEVSRLVDLGDRLRAAQESLSADELRALGRQRGQLVSGMARQAASLARESGHSISDTVLRDVETTLEAALGDPAAAEVVRSGRLVRTLARAGLDPVDLEGAMAGTAVEGSRLPSRPGLGGSGARRPADARGDHDGVESGRAAASAPVGEPRDRGTAAQEAAVREEAARQEAARQEAARQADLAEARQSVDDARRVSEQAERTAGEADQHMAEQTARREEADLRVRALEGQLSAARAESEAAADAERQARRAAADARSEADSARRALERAQSALGRLEASD